MEGRQWLFIKKSFHQEGSAGTRHSEKKEEKAEERKTRGFQLLIQLIRKNSRE